MKTREFKRKVEEIGFQIREGHGNLTICSAPLYMGFADLIQISTEYSRMLYTFSRWANINSDIQKRLWPVLVEYVGTPIAEREDEDEPKFYVNLMPAEYASRFFLTRIQENNGKKYYESVFTPKTYAEFVRTVVPKNDKLRPFLPDYDPDNTDVFVPVEEDE